jgi:hypothetical protein
MGPAVLGAVPAGALLVAVVDVAALRGTAVGRRLLGQGRTVAGLGEIGALCGEDPMDAVTELAVAVPGEHEGAGFAVFAAGRFEPESVLGCAERIVSARGGRPVRTTEGRFGVLRDASLEPDSAELAVAPGGPVVLAERAYLRRSLATAAGSAPSMREAAAHRRLRERVEPGLLVGTMVLEERQRSALAEEPRARGAPITAVTAAALGLHIEGGADGEALRAHGAVACDRVGACAELGKLLETRRDELASFVSASWPDVSRWLGDARFWVEPEGSAAGETLHARARLPVEAAARLLGALAGRGVPRASTTASATPAESASAAPASAPSAAR